MAEMRVTNGEAALGFGRRERVAGRREHARRFEEDKPGAAAVIRAAAARTGVSGPTQGRWPGPYARRQSSIGTKPKHGQTAWAISTEESQLGQLASPPMREV